MKPASLNPFFIKQLLAAACITSIAYAATATKTGTGTDLTDITGIVWTGGSGTGGSPTSTDIATWDSSSLGTGLTAATAVNWGSINITGAQTNIGITGAGTITTGNITLAGDKALTIGNNMALSGNSSYNIADVTGSTVTDATFSGAISGAFGITKTGAGTLMFSGANSYTGGTTVSAGTLMVNAGNYTKDGNGRTNLYTMSVASGATLNLVNNGAAGSYSFPNCLVIQNLTLSGSGALITSGTGVTDLWGGSTNLSAFTGTFHATSGTMAFQTSLTSGVNAMVLDTGAYLDLRTDGGITLSSLTGTGRIGSSWSANMQLTVGALNASSQFDGVIQNTVPGYSNSPSIALTKIGTGTLTLTGANTYTGTTTINGGTLALDYATQNNNKIASGAALILNGGGISILGNGAANTTQTVLGTTLNAGSSSATVTKNAATHNAALNLNTITRGVGGALNVAYAGTGSGTAAVTTDSLNDSTGILGTWATVGGTDWARNSTNAADGVITAFTGYVTDTWGAGNHTDVTLVGVDPASGSTTASLRFNATGAKTLTLAGANTLSSGGILVTGNVGANATTINGGTLAASELIIQQHNTSGALTIGSEITGATALTKAGAGTLILSGAKTYTGKTYLSGGVTQISADNNMGTAPGAAVADQLTFAGGSLRLGATFNLANNRGITINTAGGTIDTNGFSSTYAGVIAGAGNLTKTGAGILTLSGSNSFTGGVNIDAGTLQVGVQNGLTGSNSITLAANSTNATLYFNAANTAIKSLTVGANATGATLTSARWAPQINGPTILNSALTVKGVNTGAWNGVVFKDRITGDGAGAGNDTLIMDANGQTGTVNAFVWQYDAAVANNFVGNVRVTGGTTNAQALGGNYDKNNLMFTDSALLTIDTGSRFRWNNTSGYAVNETIDGLAGGGILDRAGAGVASTLTINANNTANEGDRIFSGSLLNFASLTIGSGTQQFKDTTVTSTTVNISPGAILSLNRSVNGFTNRTTIGGNALVLNGGTLSIDSTTNGLAGGWVTVNGSSGSLSGAGTININSGVFARDNTQVNTINTTATVYVASGAYFGAGRGGNSTIGALNGEGTVSTLWSGSNAGSITIGNGNGDGSFSGTIRGNGNATDGNVDGGIMSVIKTGTGTQSLSGTNTYTGATSVNQGRLNINGSITSNTGVGTSGTAAILGGDGTITGSLNVGANGSLLPGQGGITDRTLNVTGNVSAVAGANVTFSISNEASMDRLIVGGSMDLTNFNLTVNMDDTSFTELGLGMGDDFLTQLDSFDLANGSFFKIVSGTTTGMFSNVTGTMDASMLTYYGLSGTQYTTEIEGRTFWVAQGSTYLVAIPEPRAALIGGLSLLALLRRRRN
jgi:fibronectin-binding autotransporter adhesin